MAGVFIYGELPPKERIITLSKLCIRRESFAYTRSLTEEELNAEKDVFARRHMRKDQLQDELKAEQNRIKGELKEIETENAKTLEIITMEQKKCEDEVFLIPDHTTNTVAYVTKQGEIVHTREMRADERQGRLFDNTPQQPTVTVGSVPDPEPEEQPEEQPEDGEGAEELPVVIPAGEEEPEDTEGIIGVEEETVEEEQEPITNFFNPPVAEEPAKVKRGRKKKEA